MKVAIIGGGISALGVAWYLKGDGHEVDVYEKHDRVGGDCSTVTTTIGDLDRWADLAVNDFNRRTYRTVVAVMDELGVDYRDLEDTASFFTLDGDVVYTIDGDYDTRMPDDLDGEFRRFRAAAADFVGFAHRYEGFTVEDFLKDKGFSYDLARLCVYPRINAMYFCHDAGPGSMPIEAVMHYYVLQEGFGTQEGPERKYFAGGTRPWIEKLTGACGARMRTGAGAVQLSAFPDHVTVHGRENREDYDTAVIACHAVDALACFREGLTEEVASVLQRFTYLDSVAVLHTYTGVLPQRRNAWRTYNVLIRPEGTRPSPYAMTYLENRHQNDANNTEYNFYGGPEFFTSMNPQVRIPSAAILRDRDTGRPAVQHFPHHAVSFASLAAQQQLPSVQGTNSVFFAGGWTLGAGLHEECWESAMRVASLVQGKEVDRQHLYHEGPDGRRRAPHYLRRAVGHD